MRRNNSTMRSGPFTPVLTGPWPAEVRYDPVQSTRNGRRFRLRSASLAAQLSKPAGDCSIQSAPACEDCCYCTIERIPPEPLRPDNEVRVFLALYTLAIVP